MTEKIDPSKFVVKTELFINNVIHTLIREKKTLTDRAEGVDHTYFIPKNGINYEFLSKILEIDNNHNILSNILGAFYIDQKNGWNVFNRGTILNGHNLNIDQLLFGFSNIDESLFVKQNKLKKLITDYQNVIDIYNIQKEWSDYFDESYAIDEEVTKIQNEIDLLKIDLNQHKTSKKSIQDIIAHNKYMWDYIDSIHIYVSDSKGEPIEVKKENILYSKESEELLNEKMYFEECCILEINEKINVLNNRIKELICTNELFSDPKIIGTKPEYHIDIDETKQHLKVLKLQYASIQEEIEKQNSKVKYLAHANEILLDFSEKLGVLDILNKNKMILCNNFKQNTGTQEQKLLLAYRLSILKILSEYTGVQYPIIIDSISRETDENNLRVMYDFIYNEFSNHQIIISTICSVPYDPFVIKIEGQLLKKK